MWIVKCLIVYALPCVIITCPLFSQTNSDTISVRLGQLVSIGDSNLVPFSESIRIATTNELLDTSYYVIDYYTGKLQLKRCPNFDCNEPISLVVQYELFESAPQRTIRLRDPLVRRDSLTLEDYYYLVPPDPSIPNPNIGELYSSRDLVSSGSLSRAVTVGSNRDLGVNSDFRLQLDGQLGDGVEVTAAITDQNIPIQPSGTTQQLQDFDRVFIQLRKLRHQITFGDFEVVQRNTRFANIYRNVLGVQYQYRDENWNVATNLSVSKGRFHTMSFQGVNGKQGPYRLQGRQGENFIIILAGSEKVYLNGRLLTRGEDRDYIIEYNTGELTFTANQPITVNSRIVVDFEYSDRSYARTLWFSSASARLGQDDRLRLRASYGRESDNPNSPLDLELRDQDRLALRNAGDNTSLALSSGIDTIGWNPTLVCYYALDSVIGGTLYPNVLVYTTDSLLAQFRVFFSNVGLGNGDYVRDVSRVNGNVFKWLAPDSITGARRGEYAPVRLLPMPRMLQNVSVSVEYDIAKNLVYATDNSMSVEDRNRLSPIDDTDNRDFASFHRLELKPIPVVGKLRVGAYASAQYVGSRYQGFDRVYEREYGRGWNFNDLGRRDVERVYDGGVRFRIGDAYNVLLSSGYRVMGDSLFTNRQVFEFSSTDSSGLYGKNVFSRIESQDIRLMRTSLWVRNEGEIGRLFFKYIYMGSEVWGEYKRESQSDSLLAGTYRFADLKPYLKLVNVSKLQVDMWWRFRRDEEMVASIFRLKSINQQPGLRIQYAPWPQLRLSNTTHYQRFDLRDTVFERQGLTDLNVLISNSQVGLNSKNGAFVLNLQYELTAEQIARRQEVFVEVTPGLGQYEWVDNNNNQVQELDEFRLSANPLIANFVKVLSPTTELIPATGLRNGVNLLFDTKRAFPTERAGIAELLRNTSLNTSFRLDQRRQTQAGSRSIYYPLLGEAASRDTSLLNNLMNLRQDLFFWRNSPKGDLAISYQEQFTRLFLNSGAEVRQGRAWTSKLRLNLGSKRSAEAQLLYGFKLLRADLLLTRNFHIDYFKTIPSHIWQVSRKVRIACGYEFQWKRNLEAGGVTNSRLLNHKIFGDFRINFGNRNSIFAKIEMLNIRRLGDANANATFELMEGNQNGFNVTGNLLFTYYLTRYLELSIAYDARISRVNAPVHSARMQLRAIF